MSETSVPPHQVNVENHCSKNEERFCGKVLISAIWKINVNTSYYVSFITYISHPFQPADPFTCPSICKFVLYNITKNFLLWVTACCISHQEHNAFYNECQCRSPSEDWQVALAMKGFIVNTLLSKAFIPEIEFSLGLARGKTYWKL